jgi:hypothetical protein
MEPLRGGARGVAAALGGLIGLEVLGAILEWSGALDAMTGELGATLDAWDQAAAMAVLAGHVVALVGLLGRRSWGWYLTIAVVAFDVVVLPMLELRRSAVALENIMAVGLALLIDAGILALLDRPQTRADCGIGTTPRLPVRPLALVGVLLGVAPLLSTPSGIAAVAAFVAIVWYRRRRRQREG